NLLELFSESPGGIAEGAKQGRYDGFVVMGVEPGGSGGGSIGRSGHQEFIDIQGKSDLIVFVCLVSIGRSQAQVHGDEVPAVGGVGNLGAQVGYHTAQIESIASELVNFRGFGVEHAQVGGEGI